MITPELIERINFLAKKKRETGLSPEEEVEQAEVRRQYIEGIKAQIKPTLEAYKKGDQEAIPHVDGCGCEECKH